MEGVLVGALTMFIMICLIVWIANGAVQGVKTGSKIARKVGKWADED